MPGRRLRDLLLSAEAAASGSGAAVAPGGRAACWHGLGEDLELRGRQGCRLGRRVPAGAVGPHVGAAAPDVVRRSWSACSCPEQRGLRVAVSCGVAARGRVVACRGGGPERRCRLSAQGAAEQWMSRRRPREICSFEGMDLVSCGRRGCHRCWSPTCRLLQLS